MSLARSTRSNTVARLVLPVFKGWTSPYRPSSEASRARLMAHDERSRAADVYHSTLSNSMTANIYLSIHLSIYVCINYLSIYIGAQQQGAIPGRGGLGGWWLQRRLRPAARVSMGICCPKVAEYRVQSP